MRFPALLLALLVSCPVAAVPTPEFQAWIAAFRQDAKTAGISEATLDAALAHLEPIDRVLELDRQQPEFVTGFADYVNARITARTVARGRAKLAEHWKTLDRIQRNYGVPPRVLVALWGLETHYGRGMGGFPVIGALATLAFDGRRSQFFRGELLNALRMVDKDHVPPGSMKGSWAGAMGHMQFMPSTFLRYAVDGDDDGRIDVWKTPADALHSAAKLLRAIGWEPGRIWGRKVRLPEKFNAAALSGTRKSVTAWAAMGVRNGDGRRLPQSTLEGAVVLPQGRAGPAFLVYRNFDVLMRWNRSVNFALAVGMLSDRLAGRRTRITASAGPVSN